MILFGALSTGRRSRVNEKNTLESMGPTLLL